MLLEDLLISELCPLQSDHIKLSEQGYLALLLQNMPMMNMDLRSE